MARKRTTGRKRSSGRAPPDREALGLILLSLGLLSLAVLVPQIPTGDLLRGTRDAAVGAAGLAVHALPWPLLMLGGLFLTRRQPTAWPRMLLGYVLVVAGMWALIALFAPGLTGTWGETWGSYMRGAAGALGFVAALVVASFGVELIVNWPLTTIVRVATSRSIDFLRTAWTAGMSARRRAKQRAGFHADVVQERIKLRDLDRDLAALAGLYPGSSEVVSWRTAVEATRVELSRSPNQGQLEDARMDVAAWQAAVSGFTRDRAAELATTLGAEGVTGFEDRVRALKAELDEAVIEPVPPARALDDLRKALTLDLTALHERHRRLTRERDLAQAGLKGARPRDLVKVTAQHEQRREHYRAVAGDMEELEAAVGNLESWRPLAVDVFRAMNEFGGVEELKDYTTTLTGELREKGREVLAQREGWNAALHAVVERARTAERTGAMERRLAEERAVEERVRALGAAGRADGRDGAAVAGGEVIRWPRDQDATWTSRAAVVPDGPPTVDDDQLDTLLIPGSAPAATGPSTGTGAMPGTKGSTTAAGEAGHALPGRQQPLAQAATFGPLLPGQEPPAGRAANDAPPGTTPPQQPPAGTDIPPAGTDRRIAPGTDQRPPPTPDQRPPHVPGERQPGHQAGHAAGSADVRPSDGKGSQIPPGARNRPQAPAAGALDGVPPAKQGDAETDIPRHGGIPIQLPPYSLLDPVEPSHENPQELDREVRERVGRIDDTLSNFRLEGRVVASVRGPTVTRFEVEPAPGEKISRFANLSDDLALAMAVGSVRIEAPIPGKSVIGLEVPNANRDLIRFREAAEAASFRRSKARLPLILGKSIDGELVVADLARMPHLLIAGSTGSGKSVAVNTLVGSLLYKFLPTELRFLMVDPKMVELTPYDGVPHLLRPVVTNPADAAAVLLGAVAHMERRYKMMSKLGTKSLDQYNEKARNLDLPQLPFVVIIIDELADLMITSPKEVESAIMRLAQMARATGMHLVLATQRPSVDILTSLIKVNVPARMAFAVSSGHDSRTILDAMGAERLVGMGDMLYYQPGLVKPVRLQGPFISENEIAALTEFMRRQYFDDEFVEAYGDDFDPPALHESEADGYVDWNDDKLRVAAEMVIQEGQASVSRLQRRLQVGHARAGKLMDSLEALGVVGPHTGSKPREVLVAFDELPNIFGK